MFKPLLRVIPSLSGNVKIACFLTDYTKTDSINSKGTYECNIRKAKLLPLSHEIFQYGPDINLCNSSYEFDIVKFFKGFITFDNKDSYKGNSNNFWESYYSPNYKAVSIYDKYNIQYYRNTDMEFGCKRLSYKKFNYQFAFFAPMYIDNFNDIPDYFLIKLKISNSKYNKTKYIKINIGLNAEYNYLSRYLNNFCSQLDDNVIYCLPATNEANYYGISVERGGFISVVDKEIGQIYENQNSINNFDYIINKGFKRNKIIMKQILPLSFYFNPEELFKTNELTLYKNSTIDITGQYYKDGKACDFYDFSTDYENYTESIYTFNNYYGGMNWLKTGNNIMDTMFPALNESRFVGYTLGNKLTKDYNRWKLKYSDDEHPYITNMSWAFNKNQGSYYRYGQFPINYNYITGIANLIKKNGLYYYNFIFPFGNTTKYYNDADKTYIIEKFRSIMNNHYTAWYNILDKYTKDIFFPLNSEWKDVEDNKVYYKGVLYDFSYILNNFPVDNEITSYYVKNKDITTTYTYIHSYNFKEKIGSSVLVHSYLYSYNMDINYYSYFTSNAIRNQYDYSTKSYYTYSYNTYTLENNKTIYNQKTITNFDNILNSVRLSEDDEDVVNLTTYICNNTSYMYSYNYIDDDKLYTYTYTYVNTIGKNIDYNNLKTNTNVVLLSDNLSDYIDTDMNDYETSVDTYETKTTYAITYSYYYTKTNNEYCYWYGNKKIDRFGLFVLPQFKKLDKNEQLLLSDYSIYSDYPIDMNNKNCNLAGLPNNILNRNNIMLGTYEYSYSNKPYTTYYESMGISNMFYGENFSNWKTAKFEVNEVFEKITYEQAVSYLTYDTNKVYIDLSKHGNCNFYEADKYYKFNDIYTLVSDVLNTNISKNDLVSSELFVESVENSSEIDNTSYYIVGYYLLDIYTTSSISLQNVTSNTSNNIFNIIDSNGIFRDELYYKSMNNYSKFKSIYNSKLNNYSDFNVDNDDNRFYTTFYRKDKFLSISTIYYMLYHNYKTNNINNTSGSYWLNTIGKDSSKLNKFLNGLKQLTEYIYLPLDKYNQTIYSTNFFKPLNKFTGKNYCTYIPIGQEENDNDVMYCDIYNLKKLYENYDNILQDYEYRKNNNELILTIIKDNNLYDSNYTNTIVYGLGKYKININTSLTKDNENVKIFVSSNVSDNMLITSLDNNYDYENNCTINNGYIEVNITSITYCEILHLFAIYGNSGLAKHYYIVFKYTNSKDEIYNYELLTNEELKEYIDNYYTLSPTTTTTVAPTYLSSTTLNPTTTVKPVSTTTISPIAVMIDNILNKSNNATVDKFEYITKNYISDNDNVELINNNLQLRLSKLYRKELYALFLNKEHVFYYYNLLYKDDSDTTRQSLDNIYVKYRKIYIDKTNNIFTKNNNINIKDIYCPVLDITNSDGSYKLNYLYNNSRNNYTNFLSFYNDLRYDTDSKLFYFSSEYKTYINNNETSIDITDEIVKKIGFVLTSEHTFNGDSILQYNSDYNIFYIKTQYEYYIQSNNISEVKTLKDVVLNNIVHFTLDDSTVNNLNSNELSYIIDDEGLKQYYYKNDLSTYLYENNVDTYENIFSTIGFDLDVDLNKDIDNFDSDDLKYDESLGLYYLQSDYDRYFNENLDNLDTLINVISEIGFELCYKKVFYKVDDTLYKIMNLGAKYISDGLSNVYKDLYLYRIYKPYELNTNLKVRLENESFTSKTLIANNCDEQELDKCLTPLFTDIYLQSMQEAEIYTEYMLDTIYPVNIWNRDFTFYKLDTNDSICMLQVTKDSLEASFDESILSTIDYYIKYECCDEAFITKYGAYNKNKFNILAKNEELPDIMEFAEDYGINTYYNEIDGKVYGFYLIESHIDNTLDTINSVFINKLSEGNFIEYSKNIKYYQYIDGKKIGDSINAIYSNILPFTNINILGCLYQLDTVIYPNIYNIKLYYKQFALNKDINEVNIKFFNNLNKSAKLLRYFDAITPYIPKTSYIENQYYLKYKNKKADILLSINSEPYSDIYESENSFRKLQSIGDTVIYKDILHIDKFNGLRIYDKPSNKLEDAKVVYPIEYKSYNDNKYHMLETEISIKVDKLLTYNEVLEYETKEIVLKYFKNYINKSFINKYNDTEILFLYNKYEINFITSAKQLDLTKSYKLYSLEYKFTLY